MSRSNPPGDGSNPPGDDDELVARYRKNYGLAETQELRADQVWYHLQLEQRLTAELRSSRPEDRWATFERCYDELYEGLPWLSDVGGADDTGRWAAIIGKTPQRVYEVGSGAGRMALRPPPLATE